ncbi:MAG TPA: TonB family protein [Polyangia bacterium]
MATLVGSVLAASLGAIPRAWAGDAAAEPAIKTPGPVGDYLRLAHTRVHARWAEGFLKPVATATPAAPATAADGPREATIALTIRWDGTVAEATVRSSSSSTEFDHAAVDAIRKSAPFPLPTSEVLSDDGYAHFEWTLSRDSRACAAGAKLVRVEDPIEVSLPRLVMSNRIEEALRRVGEVNKGDGALALDRFARLYLGRSVPDPLLDATASVALAETGDKVQIGRLKGALTSRATVRLAAKGLQKLGVDICDAVREPMESGTAMGRETAFEAARVVAASGASIAGCRTKLEALVKDDKQAQSVRLSALDILTTNFRGDIRPLVLGLMTDKDAGVRGAATFASVKKGGGRPEMYRLAPLLHDKTVEVRGAASAGIIRAAGDLALDQLYLLARETDPRPARAVAAELGTLSSAASAEFLGHMLKRDNREVQLAAARALATRSDPAARAQLDAMKTMSGVSPELLALANGTAAASDKDATPSADAALAQLQEFLKARRTHDAVGWVVERFPTFSPHDAIEVLGAWLVRQPTAAAEATPASGPAAPASSAPRAAL